MVNFATESRVDVLRQAAQLLDTENRRLHQRLQSMCKELAVWRGTDPDKLQIELIKLQELVEARNRELFGDRSERRATTTGGSGSGGETQTTESFQGHGPTEQPDLPSIIEVHAMDEADLICPSCGGDLQEMKGQSEDAEEIDVVERRLVVRNHKRLKYRCKCNSCVETAPGPDKLIPGGRYSVNFAANVAVDKYSDHIPWDRQVRRFSRDGLRGSVATLWDLCDALARRLEPLVPVLRAYLLSLAVIGADETWWRLMDKKRNGGTNKKWWAWALCSEQAVYFELRPKRSSDVVVELLLDYGGKLMVDGHGAYKKGQKRGAKYILVFCWAHVRRKFLEAEKSYPREAGAIMDLIDELFRIDREAARAPPDTPEPLVERRRRLRQARSVWVIKALECWATDMKVLPQSSLGRAVRYMVDHWKGLIHFLDDPLVPLSNNASERAVRGPVVGRKNFGGCKSERGMEVAALLYSLVESAKLCDVDPREYLREMALRSIRGQDLVLPHVYAAQKSAKSASYAL